MHIKFILKNSLQAIKTNKSRSALTVLGIVIGISSIVLIMSIGRSAESLILREVETLGGAFVQINPGKDAQGPSSMASSLLLDSLKERDVEALKNKNNVPYLKDVTPSLMVPASVSYGSEIYRPTILGWTATWLADLYDIYPEEGNYFTEEDIKSLAPLAVIGQDVKKELFGSANALGKKIKIKNKYFRIVAILPPSGSVSSFMNVDEFIVIPYTVAQKYLLGVDHYQEIHIIAESEELVPQMVKDIELTLRDLHGIDDPKDDDFNVTTQGDIIDTIKLITSVLTVLLTSVAAISLVVGGVGIMNIMLVSVTERTREIGLRKALGATSKNVLHQFLIESIILTIIGGIIGISLGIAFSFLSALVLGRVVGPNWQFVVSIESMFLGLGVAGSVGLIFGYYPARKAARLSPIEALRHE
ncbi:ABC transporter permease [Patescibacteria group bacterium]|nr:ABC transporter permease [Patescibacteria group bacterium]